MGELEETLRGSSPDIPDYFGPEGNLDPMGPGMNSFYMQKEQRANQSQLEGKMPFESIKYDVKKGNVHVVTSAENAQHYLDRDKKLTEIETGYNAMFAKRQQEIDAQIERAKAHPLLNVLGTFASQVAQQKDMPGMTQALGRTAQQLNPNIHQLQAEQMGMAEKSMGLMSLLESREAREQEDRLRHAELSEARALRVAQYGVTQEDKRRKEVEGTSTKWVKRAEGSSLMPGFKLNTEQFAKEMTEAKATPDEIATAQETINETLAAAGEAKKIAAERRLTEKQQAAVFTELLQEKRDNHRNELIKERTAGFIELRQKVAQENMKFRSDVQVDQQFKKLDPKEVNQLEGAYRTRKYLDAVSPLLDDPEFNKYIGPIRLNKIAEWGPMTVFRSPEQQAVMTELIHEIPRVVKLFEMGVRAYSPSELWLVKKAGANQDLTVAQVKEVFRIVDRVNKDNVTAVMASKDGIDWEKKIDLVGIGALETWREHAGSTLKPAGADVNLPPAFTDALKKKPGTPAMGPDGKEYQFDRTTKVIYEKVPMQRESVQPKRTASPPTDKEFLGAISGLPAGKAIRDNGTGLLWRKGPDGKPVQVQ